VVHGRSPASPASPASPIAGAAEKVVAAERDGADVFLVPREHYDEARAGARMASLVPVDRFEGAVRALGSLEPTGELMGLSPPPPCIAPLADAVVR
jgi:PDZ domain-containing protein